MSPALKIWSLPATAIVLRDCEFVGGGVAEELFERGLCLPSGCNLSEADLALVVGALRALRR